MISKNGVRILTPMEFDKLSRAITKYDYKILLSIALYTGMRYVELRRLQRHPEWFLKDRNCIHLPKEAMKKKKRKMQDRYVYLVPASLNYLDMFFKIRKLPRIQQWNNLLKNWAFKANLGSEGISAKITRKTWESWLAISNKDKIEMVCMNQGHTQFIAIKHYLNLPFTDEEKQQICNRTAGWMI